MIRLIAADLDETLLTTQKHVSGYTARQIRKAEEQGIHFVCATGRPFFSIQNTLREIGQYRKKGTYTISYNGACVSENENNTILYTCPLDVDLAEEIYRFGLRFDVCIHIYTVDTTYVYRLNEDERNFLQGRMAVTEIDRPDLHFLRGKEIIKILYENTDQAVLKSIDALLPDAIRDRCDLSYSSNRYFEFNRKGVNKGLGLEYLCRHFNLDPTQTLAIGDNINDLGMFDKAGVACGVANLNPDIRDRVDIISPYTNDEDAVGHILEDLVFQSSPANN